MTSVTASSHQIEREESGETTLELVAVRYTGSQTIWSPVMHLEDAGWPGGAPLDGGADRESNGSWNFALVPDEGLGKIEGRPDLDVVYADQRERFAELLLDQHRLPGNVFGRGADRDVQDRVFDALGLAPIAEAGPFEEQLRAVAGVDEPEEDDAEAELTTVQKFIDEYTRSELGDVAKALRDDASEFNLRDNAAKTDRAEFIAGFEKDARASAVEAALGGDDE